ncbi:hypothetical protein JW930_06235 [Candidatus Woesearchaeota archaeon]|nr:hypothetical protein [Candidatus Woesearchaeota archaeon]
MKKGTVELQFNWVFVLFAGAIILGFFIVLSTRIFRGSSESLNYELLTYLDEIFTGIEATDESEHKLTLPAELEMDCNFFTIKKSEYEGKSLQNRVIFGPNLIKGDLVSYSTYWEIPYKTNVFIFFTSSQVQYVIIKDDSTLANKLYDVLPDNMNKVIVSNLDDYENQNYYKLVFIFFTDTVPEVNNNLKVNDNEIAAIKITPEKDKLFFPGGYGKVEFYYKQGDSFILDGESVYLGKASLFGAIYSESKETYECNIKKALARSDIITDILIQRTEVLDAGSTCNYLNTITKLHDIKNILANQVADSSLGILYDHAFGNNGLKDLNKDLQQLSCPQIY